MPNFDDNLNFITSDTFRSSFDVQTTLLQSTLKKMAGKFYTPDTMDGTIFYAGVVMEFLGEVKITDSPSTQFSAMFAGGENRGVRQYRVFIPELYYGVVPPTIFSKNTSIKALDPEQRTEFAKTKQIITTLPKILDFRPGAVEEIDVGDAVWVMFQNARTNENGYVFSKILNDQGAMAGAYLEGKSVANLKMSDVRPAPPDRPRDRNSREAIENPPGFNGSFIFDYSEIIQLMTESKGWPYRYGTYPYCISPNCDREKYALGNNIKDTSVPLYWAQNAIMNEQTYKSYEEQFPNINLAIALHKQYNGWEYGQLGLDCIGFVRSCLKRLGLFVPPPASGKDTRTAEEKYAWSRLLLAPYTLYPGQNDVFEPVPVGSQVPGDVAYFPTHVMLVVSYPIPSIKNHSVLWGANGSGPKCNRCWKGGVGVNVYKGGEDPENTKQFFSPVIGSVHKPTTYGRIKKKYVPLSFFTKMNRAIADMASNPDAIAKGSTGLDFFGHSPLTIENFMSNNSLWEWPFKIKNFRLTTIPKYNPSQYKYPAKPEEHPDAVINAPDQFFSERVRIKSRPQS